MAICSFRFEFPVTAEELIRRVGDAVRSAGGSFSGDTGNGKYSVWTPIGSVSGNYFISGQTIQIDVTDKPIILSCNLIETKLNQYIRMA